MQSIKKIEKDCPLLKSENEIAFEQAFECRRQKVAEARNSAAWKNFVASRNLFNQYWSDLARI